MSCIDGLDCFKGLLESFRIYSNQWKEYFSVSRYLSQFRSPPSTNVRACTHKSASTHADAPAHTHSVRITMEYVYLCGICHLTVCNTTK